MNALAKATMVEIQRELLLRAIGRNQENYNRQWAATEAIGKKLQRQRRELGRLNVCLATTATR